MWSVSSGDRFFVGAMDSSEAMVLMGLMEKAEKHGVLDEYYRQVKSGKQHFFLSGCCMAQRRFVVRAVALLSAKTK